MSVKPAGLERYAPVATGIALALPTLIAHYPPMTDLPLHEGLVGILRHFGDPEYFSPGLYELNLGHPNQLFHLVSLLLSFLVGTRWAVKIVIAATQIAILWAGARLADHLGRSRWAAVLLAPLALGFTYYWGLIANLLGYAVLLAALPIIDRMSARPTGRSVAATSGLFVLLFFAHESVLVLAAVFAGMLAILHRLDRRRTPLRLLPSVFAFAVVMTHYVLARRSFGKLQLQAETTYPPLLERVQNVPNDIFGSHDLGALLALFVLATSAAIALLVRRIRSREPRPEPTGGALRRTLDVARHYRFELAGAAFVLGYAVAPSAWNSNNLLYSRLAGPAWALLILTAAPRTAVPRLLKLVITVVPAAILLVSWPQFVDSHTTAKDLDQLVARIPMNSAVLFCNFDRPLFRTRVFWASASPARAIADRGGRMSLSLVTSPIAPARIAPRYRWDEFDLRARTLHPHWIIPEHDLARFSYSIAHSRDPFLRDALVHAYLPDARLVDQRGEWLLLRSTHPAVPVASLDANPPPGLPTLLDRMKTNPNPRNQP